MTRRNAQLLALLGAGIFLHAYGAWRVAAAPHAGRDALAPPTLSPMPRPIAVTDPSVLLGGQLFFDQSFAQSDVEAGAGVQDGAATTIAVDVPPPSPPPEAPAPTLQGTAVAAGSAVAVLRSADGRSALLRVGDRIDGWRIVSIASRRVTIRDGSRTVRLVLPVAEATALALTPPQPRRETSSPSGDAE
ncbi:MAG: hypothetical protein HC774_03600 [Sphingomonadales bacterium]|nr:hypothetical protein [Sphingomonadales bacterium]